MLVESRARCVADMWTIDGSEGEGGGQILRTALSLSLVTGTPFRIHRIRKHRRRPGLLRQHLTAVNAAAAVGAAEVTGAEMLSEEVTFHPSGLVGGEHIFKIGSAGSTTLVLQTILPALLQAKDPSTIVLEGGTHNPMAPPFEFLEHAYLPILSRMGASVTAMLERPGFHPAGGGRMRVLVKPAERLKPISLDHRGEILRTRAIAKVANLPPSIAMRELSAARRLLGWDPSCFRPEVLRDNVGPGNVLNIFVQSEHVTEVFTGFGERGVRAELVGERAAREAMGYLEAGVPVGEHLADQLLLPMVLAGKGSFRTVPASSHAVTHAELLTRLIGAKIRMEAESELVHRVEVEA